MRVQNGARHQPLQLAASAGRQGPADGWGGGGAGAATSHGAALPLLPLFDHVLLPGGFLRVTIPAEWRKSGALVEHLLQRQGPGELLVAAVPFLTAGAGAGASGGAAAAPAPAPEEADEGGDASLDLERLHHTGTAARVLQLVRRTASGGWSVTLEGRCRLRVRGVHLASRPPSHELYEASVEQLDYFAPGGGPGRGAAVAIGAASGGGAAASAGGREQEELARELLKGTRRLFLLIQGESEGREAAARVARALAQQGPARMSDVLGSLVARSLHARLALLGSLDVTARLKMVVDLLNQMLEVAEKAAAGGSGRGGPRRGGRAPGAVGEGRRGGLRLPGLGSEEEEEEEEEGKAELAALMQRLKAANPPPEVLRAAQREYKRLQRGSEQHPGYGMSLAYLETLADLPWERFSVMQQPQRSAPAAAGDGDDEGEGEGGGAARAGTPWAAPAPPQLPLAAVRQRLDEAHYGLEKIKERIVQYVAVQRLRGWDARAPILCFIGPPGVGKTSLARSIAEVLGRPFQRIALGGVRDEAEVRGHRRTYIGAMPGRLIQAVRKAGVRDPLLLLDEVDKMGRDARGDPAAALLEVLDPEQNSSFVDTYLGLPFDLSCALFVATANRASDIPPPLLDRLEVVQLGGYTVEEKLHIAERHLIPRLLAEHGLQQGQLVFPSAAVRSLLEGYTAEAGVRSLARCLSAVCRHVAVQVVQHREERGGGGGDGSGGGGGGRRLPFLGGGSGEGGGIELPLPLPPSLDDADAAARAARLAVAGEAPRQAPRRHLPALHTGSGGLQLEPAGAAGPAGVRLWAQLLPLAAVDVAGGCGASAAATVAAATGGYPWRQLQQPVHSIPAPAPPADCSCSPRKQSGWFSWLRWGRHEAMPPPEPLRELAASGEAAAGGPCACSGGCSDPDCCCHAGQGRSEGAAEHWGGPLHAGTAADSSGWEAGWRGANAEPLLCGPGSMQILPPAALPPRCALPAAAQSGAAAHVQPRQEGEDGEAPLLPAAPHAEQQQQLALQPQQHQQIVVDDELIEAVLGPRRYEGHHAAERVAAPGSAAGLVWTSVGGKVQYIECMCVGTGRSGRSGQLTLTGQLGDVLGESARIALSWVRAHAEALGLPGGSACPSRKWDVHIHLPAGAVPKDGPSAGVTLAVALVSLFADKCVRTDVAMTGELTLRGLVLPVGGIKEKLLAAQAAGMARVLVPARNMPDVQADVPAEVRQALEVLPCQRLQDVLRGAFDPPLELQQPAARL